MDSKQRNHRNETAVEAEYYTSEGSDSNSRSRALKRLKPINENTTKEKALDRLSSLPDSLLLHILSFLNIERAARTSILSKRWQFLWTFLPVLEFPDPSSLDYMPRAKMFALVNRTLILHQSSKLKRFTLEFSYKEEFVHDVDIWLRIAARKNVEELCLDFRVNCDDEDEPDCYGLPLSVLSNSNLVKLYLGNCGLECGGLITWSSLKDLSLSTISLNNDLIRQILSGSPSLEYLGLYECWNYDFLDVKSERLRKLNVTSFGDDKSDLVSDIVLKISAPNVKSLEVSGFLKVKKLLLLNSWSLVDAELNFDLWPERYDLKYAKMVEELLEKLRHVRNFHLGIRCFKGLFLPEVKPLPCWQSTWKFLIVNIDPSQAGLSAFMRLLALAPLLETLVIGFATTSSDFKKAEFQESHEFDIENYLRSVLLKIKTVKILNFMAKEHETEIISLLLKNAMQLEKMIIRTCNADVKLNKSVEVFQRILGTPRCSKNSVVLFS